MLAIKQMNIQQIETGHSTTSKKKKTKSQTQYLLQFFRSKFRHSPNTFDAKTGLKWREHVMKTK
jgi:hypothetical protein